MELRARSSVATCPLSGEARGGAAAASHLLSDPGVPVRESQSVVLM